MKNKATLQINLAPVDYLHARVLLKHQLSALAGQVDEVLLIVDTQPAQGRFAEGWNTYKTQFDHFLSAEIAAEFKVRIVPVDYSKTAKEAVAQLFFGTTYIPDNDFRGGPFYVYFFGLWQAKNNIVFHLDSDIFLGGQSQNWINEAVNFFEQDDRCLIVSPLPGPPHPDKVLKGQSIIRHIAPYTYQLDGMSTRLFMIDKFKFEKRKLSLHQPSLRNQLKAVIEGNANADLPEHIIASYMRAHGLKRIDFLGSGDGMWSLHPPYRTQTFYRQLPNLIERIINNELPLSQRGFYDIVDEVCDWTEARQKLKHNRWWKRIWNR
ncbi:polysaccharide biosynthesis glycosyltransferase UppG [Mucilaginibacter koreensis]